ncbi:MAG: hypothetical protein GTO18_08255 [Anaerolineales bacterium]|nr:hypothetical protein [Anaerolineales bacterium]
MLTIEIGDPRDSSACPDCGAEIQSVFGYIYENNDALAIYDAAFSQAHYDQGASIRIIIGDWSEDTEPLLRHSFGLEVRVKSEEFEIMLVGPDRSMWGESDLASPMLSREQALSHPEKSRIFHIVEHIIHEDPRIHEFFSGN